MLNSGNEKDEKKMTHCSERRLKTKNQKIITVMMIMKMMVKVDKGEDD